MNILKSAIAKARRLIRQKAEAYPMGTYLLIYYGLLPIFSHYQLSFPFWLIVAILNILLVLSMVLDPLKIFEPLGLQKMTESEPTHPGGRNR